MLWPLQQWVYYYGLLFSRSKFTKILLLLSQLPADGRYSTRKFFLKVFGRHTCPFWGHWYPCFGFLVMFPLGFKARVDSTLFAFCEGECNVHSLRSTSGATHAGLLAAGTQLVLSPHTVAEVRFINISSLHKESSFPDKFVTGHVTCSGG